MKNNLIIAASETQGQAPEWLRLLPLGKVELRDARQEFVTDAESLARIVATFKAEGVDLVIDYEHQSLQGKRAPAAGWIKDLQVRPDGLWAQVTWTPQATEYLLKREYRYFSPVLRMEPGTRKPIALMHMGLTNTPAIKGLAPLLAARYGGEGEPEILVMRDFSSDERKLAAQKGWAMPDGSFPIKSRGDLENAISAYGRAKDKEAAQKHIIARAKELGATDLLPADWPGSTKKPENGGQPMKKHMLKLLGLPETEDKPDTEILALVDARFTLAGSLPKLATALGLEKPEQATPSQIEGAILALKQGSEQLATLRTELEALKVEGAKDKAQKAVDEALKAKKITPAQVEWALKYAAENPEGFAAYVAAAVPVLVTPELKIPGNDKKPGGVLGEGEVAVCKQLGLKPEDFLATKQEQQQ